MNTLSRLQSYQIRCVALASVAFMVSLTGAQFESRFWTRLGFYTFLLLLTAILVLGVVIWILHRKKR